MFEVFLVMRQLHELLWYLADALTRGTGGALRDELRRAREETAALTHSPPDTLVQLDVAAHRRDVNALLLRTSEVVRAEVQRQRKDYRGGDLIGANLKGADLRGANLRGAYLIGADLSRADLRKADVIGADFRAADLRGANLADSLFLTQSQAGAAIGDTRTRLPSALARPSHWST
jgi:uncharacterized protein YjbI with pentapeptide repeats